MCKRLKNMKIGKICKNMFNTVYNSLQSIQQRNKSVIAPLRYRKCSKCAGLKINYK